MECQVEQSDPNSRRFRLETINCPQCGPQAKLVRAGKGASKIEASGDQAVLKAQSILTQGKLLAVQGSVGIYLVCDADRPQAVERLRQALDSPDRPLPVVVSNIQSAAELCDLEPPAARALESAARPVVIVDQNTETRLAKQAAPYLRTLGIRLPASGMEQLLFMEGEKPRFPVRGRAGPPRALIEAEIASLRDAAPMQVQEKVAALLGYVEGILLHEVEFHVQPTSVVRVFAGATYSQDGRGDNALTGVLPIRIGRGFSPLPVELSFNLPPILAGGSDRSNTICITRASKALLSGENGDLKQVENLANFEAAVKRVERLSGITPEFLAHDLDRQSLATRFILERAGRESLPAVAVQHHHAHIAACLAENSLPEGQPVVGVAFDLGGIGEDPDQARPVSWGGEFFVGGYREYKRAYHLAYLPLPGGDPGATNLARTALAYLWEAGIPWEIDLPSVSAICAQENSLLRSMLKHRLNTPLHSSMGRLFEAAASLAGLRQEVSYPIQALLEMEAAADREEKRAYTFELQAAADGSFQIDPLPVIRAVVEDVRSRARIGQVSARLHNGVAELVFLVCDEMRKGYGTNQIVLSGEVWQNILLLGKTMQLLQQGGFQVYTHRLTPPNNACISLGQAVIAGKRLEG